MSRCLRWLLQTFAAVFLIAPALAGPYAPEAGSPGSTAVSMGDSSIVGWATGYTNYQVGSNVDSEWQTPSLALGSAVGDSYDIVSLGDGGSITLTFDHAIVDGVGADFCVFENSVNSTFLELAYVEVSYDGTTFYRFPSSSLTATSVDSYALTNPMDATNIDGLAGKYMQGYGTPFDLSVLNLSQYGITEINYIRLIDITGDGSCQDSAGNPIYDPYTTYGSGGFDLDAIGVMNAVPEPGTYALVLLSILMFVFVRKPTQNHS